MRHHAAALLVIACAGVPLLGACAGEPPRTALGYTADAKRSYEAAMAEFDAHNWIEADALMREVKRKYSYSKYARLAELRIADADYAQEKYPVAIHEYKDFVHAHRADAEDIGYARSRIAEATYAQIPDSLLLPAAEERDQASVVDAYKELESFLSDYPDSKDSARLRELVGQVTAHLVRHELYVARFYLNKDNYEAAVSRATYALQKYATDARTGLEPDALLLLGQTYLRMHKWGEARHAFQSVVRDYRRSPSAVKALDYLEYMSKRGV